MTKFKAALFSSLFFSSIGFACEDTVPGALPPGYWGGVIEPFRESKSETADNASKGEPQLFFEAVYQGGELRLYPLAIQPSKTSVFTKVSPTEFSEIQATAGFPWEGRTHDLPLSVTEDALTSRMGAQNTHRFIVHLKAKHRGKVKFVNLQVENGD